MSDVSYRQDRSAVISDSVGNYPTTADVVDLYSAVPEHGVVYQECGSVKCGKYEVLQQFVRAGHKFMHCQAVLSGTASIFLLPEQFEGYAVTTVAISVEAVGMTKAASSIRLLALGVTMDTVDHSIAVRHKSGQIFQLTVAVGDASRDVSIRFYLRYEPGEAIGVCRLYAWSARLSKMPPGLVRSSKENVVPHSGLVTYCTAGGKLLCRVGAYEGKLCRFVCVANSSLVLTVGRFSVIIGAGCIFRFDLMIMGRSTLTMSAVREISATPEYLLLLRVKCTDIRREEQEMGDAGDGASCVGEMSGQL